jgi:hypothetical protein
MKKIAFIGFVALMLVWFGSLITSCAALALGSRIERPATYVFFISTAAALAVVLIVLLISMYQLYFDR